MAEILMVDAATVAGWLADGSAVLVDVREPHEVAQARIAGSINVALSAFDAAAATAPVEGAPTLKLVFQCLSGRRCGVAAERLVAAGFDGTVYRLEGGLKAWHEAGLALDTRPLPNE